MNFAYDRRMARTTTGTDALVEILSFCEEALTALHPHNASEPVLSRSSKASQLRRNQRRNSTGRLQLIQGGLSPFIADAKGR